MKHNVNYVLLVVILFSVLSFVGLIVLHYVSINGIESSYVEVEGLRTKYNTALERVENLSAEMNETHMELMEKEKLLNEKEKILLQYLGQLNLSKQREDSISEHFVKEKEKVEGLEDNLDQTRDDRDRYASLYNKYYKESEDLSSDLKRTKGDLDDAKDKIARAKGDATEINNIVEDMDGELNAMANQIARIKETAEDIDDNRKNSTVVKDLSNDVEDYASNTQVGLSALNGYVNRIRNLISSIRG